MVAIMDRYEAPFPDVRLDLSQQDLRNFDFRNCNLAGANLGGGQPRGCGFVRVSAAPGSTETNFRGAQLQGANLAGADLSRARWIEADLTEVNLTGADLRFTNWKGSDLSGANLTGTDMSYVNLLGIPLPGCHPDPRQPAGRTLVRAESGGARPDGGQPDGGPSGSGQPDRGDVARGPVRGRGPRCHQPGSDGYEIRRSVTGQSEHGQLPGCPPGSCQPKPGYSAKHPPGRGHTLRRLPSPGAGAVRQSERSRSAGALVSQCDLRRAILSHADLRGPQSGTPTCSKPTWQAQTSRVRSWPGLT